MRVVWIFFLGCSFLFFIIEFAGTFGLYLPRWTRHYLKDFLCMPIVFTVCLIVLQWLKEDMAFKLKILPVIVLTALYSLYFELVLPNFIQRYTGDPLDVLMYFGGAISFYLLQFTSIKKKKAA